MAVTPAGNIFINGKSTMGINAVAYIGIASVIHQKAINSVTAPAFLASGDMPEGKGSRTHKTKSTIPPINPEYLIFFNVDRLLWILPILCE